MSQTISVPRRKIDSKVQIEGKNQRSSRDSKVKTIEPNPTDVLFGRGGKINQHEGNKKFRSLISENQKIYNLASNKKEDKTNISRNIVKQIKDSKGRFLKRENISTTLEKVTWSDWWVEVDEDKAISKTSQALREGAPGFRSSENEAHPTKRKLPDAGITKLKRVKRYENMIKKDNIIKYKESEQGEGCVSNDSLYRMELNSHDLSGLNDTLVEAEIISKDIFANPGQVPVNPERAITPNLDEEGKVFEYIYNEKEHGKLVIPELDDIIFDYIGVELNESDLTPYPIMESEYPFTDDEYQFFLLILNDLRNIY